MKYLRSSHAQVISYCSLHEEGLVMVDGIHLSGLLPHCYARHVGLN